MKTVAYTPLSFRKLNSGASFHRPHAHKLVQIGSPAIEVMTDLQCVAAATTVPDATLAQATQAMVARSVRLLFVVDATGEILGLITARDTMGDRPIKYLQENRGSKHADLKVRDIMTPVEKIEVLTMADVDKASVGHIVATLQKCGRQHAMVIDVDAISGEETVRGVFSITQIGRQLGMQLQAFEIEKAFAQLGELMAGSLLAA
jgi:CBS-domain-containing membrane protein